MYRTAIMLLKTFSYTNTVIYSSHIIGWMHILIGSKKSPPFIILFLLYICGHPGWKLNIIALHISIALPCSKHCNTVLSLLGGSYTLCEYLTHLHWSTYELHP